MSEQPRTTDGFKVPAVPKRPPYQAQPQLRSDIPSHIAPLSYEQPLNAGTPQHNYNMEVIKDGSVVESHTVARDKTYFTFGRLPICDFPMEHGSISRYHAVLQFHDDGSMTIVDLGSSHGTFINRKQITARTPSKVDIGDQIRFGASSRIWIIESPNIEHQEQHEDMQSRKHIIKTPANQSDTERQTKSHLKITKSYLCDPVKYLQGFMDKLGYEYDPQNINQDNEEDSESFGRSTKNKNQRRHPGTTSIRIVLPYTDDDENMLYGTGTAANRSEAERLACLDALKALEKHGYLETGDTSRTNASAKGVRGDDDDENDGYYDNTKVENAGYDEYLHLGKVETHESLLRKLALVTTNISEISQQLTNISESTDRGNNGDDAGDDELDVYMSALAEDDQKAHQKQLNDRLILLQAQKDKLESLIKVVAPDHSPSAVVPKYAMEAKSDNPGLSMPETVLNSEKQSNVDAPNASRSSKIPPTHTTKKRQAVSGPALEDSDDVATSKQSRIETTTSNRVYTDRDADWRPPTNQTGDGRTSLNEKYGY